ncbi:MAG: phenylalanine--tRNA ligase subunit beta [Rikenellaceae bacterium]
MNISYSWLKNYISSDVSAQEAAAMLTDAGLEVEGIEEVEMIKGGLHGLVVGEVLTCEKHPDADKLNITTVNVGGEQNLQIVCGAPNVAQGQKVIVATVGTKLYPTGDGEPFKIKKSKIRGVESFGMICAEDEIGVGESHAGIIVLDSSYTVGTEASKVYNVESDTVFEVGLTPNRVDAASHYGVARDLAALLKVNKGEDASATLPSVDAFKAGNEDISVRIENTEAAPRYSGVVMRGVKIAPSPEWLQKRLLAIGINPKNNVVDITNFVLHECGQPMHAFDLGKVGGGEIVVRNARKGEKITTLDGVERELFEDDLMICDQTRPMCIAGVFGGEESGVSESTTDIFIECAYFNPAYVRRTAKRHGLSTDSSWRYERGADPNIVEYALKRTALLVSELSGAEVTSKVIDHYPERVNPFKVEVDLNRVNTLIGKEIPQETVLNILSALEIKITSENGKKLSLEVPAYRVDVTREADITEEILRLYGFNNIENPPFIKSVISSRDELSIEKNIELISELLVSLGYNEIMSNSLTKATYYEELSTMNVEKCVKIMNPLSSELSVMRQTLLFDTLEAIALNSARKRNSLRTFEIGNTYTLNPAKIESPNKLEKYSQTMRLGIGLVGAKDTKNWNSNPEKANIFEAKAIIEKIIERLRIDTKRLKVQQGVSSDLFRSESASYTLFDGTTLLSFGKVSDKLISSFDIKPKQDVYWIEIDLDALLKMAKIGTVKVKELSKYQAVKRDLALLVDQNVTFAELKATAQKAERKLLKEVSIFDIYQGDKLPSGKKSYALSFILEDSSKTLTDNEIESVMNRISKAFLALGAEVRA